jgi:LuxR family maltose regulon positive regulatory protein
MAHARRALDLLDQVPDLLAADQDLGRAAANALIGLASWAGGDLETAHQAYVKSIASMRRAGHVTDVLGLSIALADIQITQGRLREAMRTYEQALRLVPEPSASTPALRGTADMYVGLSSLHLESDDLPRAVRFLALGEELGEHAGLPQNNYRRRLARARIRAAEGDLSDAADLLTEAEAVYVGDFSPDVRPVPASRAQIWIKQGRVADALDWARERELSALDELSYQREYEHITLARILVARNQAGHADDALDDVALLLERLRGAAEAGHRNGSLIEILMLQALVHRRRGEGPAAYGSLEHALQLAEPEDYVRMFVGEGAVMADLLAAAARRGIRPEYVRRLLRAMDATTGRGDNRLATIGRELTEPGLIEPLSRRELDVLRLLGSDLGGPEIARALVVSLNTVRTHTKNIYAKLGVTNRRAAVRRATELNL